MGFAKYNSYTCKRKNVCAQSLQSYPTLCDRMNFSPPRSSIYDILQARILESVAMPSSRDLPNTGVEPTSPASPALQADSLLLSHRGSPRERVEGSK